MKSTDQLYLQNGSGCRWSRRAARVTSGRFKRTAPLSYRPFGGPTESHFGVKRQPPTHRAPPPPTLLSETLNRSRANQRARQRCLHDTNSYEPARPDGNDVSGTAALRPCPAPAVRGCSLGSTVYGSKSPGRRGGREEGRRRRGSSRRFVPYLQPPVWGERAEGEGGTAGDTMGDVVLGYPRPALDAGEAGRGENYRYRHATRAAAAQGNWG